MIYRGTTPTLNFDLPFETELLSECYITFSQKERVVIEKKLSDCFVDTYKLSLTLTQTETLNMDEGKLKIQLRVKFLSGQITASDIINTLVEEVLKDGEI